MSGEAIDTEGQEGNAALDGESTSTAGQSTEAATAKGHQSKEDYVANGGDEDNWQSPEVFIALKGPLAKIKDQTRRIKAMETDFNSRTANVNKLHNLQVDQLRTDLVAKRTAAIEEADVTQADQYQSQIDNLQPLPETPAVPVQLSEDLETWNADPKNAWIFQAGPKADFAHKQFGIYRGKGLDDAQIINGIEADIAKHFPEVNPHIAGAPMAESGSKPGAKLPSKEITMNDLTAEEARIWRNGSSMWTDQADFLQSVKDSRSDENE